MRRLNEAEIKKKERAAKKIKATKYFFIIYFVVFYAFFAFKEFDIQKFSKDFFKELILWLFEMPASVLILDFFATLFFNMIINFKNWLKRDIRDNNHLKKFESVSIKEDSKAYSLLESDENSKEFFEAILEDHFSNFVLLCDEIEVKNSYLAKDFSDTFQVKISEANSTLKLEKYQANALILSKYSWYIEKEIKNIVFTPIYINSFPILNEVTSKENFEKIVVLPEEYKFDDHEVLCDDLSVVESSLSQHFCNLYSKLFESLFCTIECVIKDNQIRIYILNGYQPDETTKRYKQEYDNFFVMQIKEFLEGLEEDPLLMK